MNWVNYSALKEDMLFEKVVTQLESFAVSALQSKQEKLAFYINAYNIFAIKMVLDHWPVKCIKDAGGLFKFVWKKEAGKIDGKSVTLDEIEHQILRPMGEPRIHMAIVCASISCPDLRREPYAAARLDEQLDDQSRTFLNNPEKGLQIENNTIRTSKIFRWYKDDFTAIGGVKAFLHHYRNLPKNFKLKVNLRYNWSLNGQ